MSVLICGGAGYIGSHNVRALLDRGESVVVLDNLWTGHRAALPGTGTEARFRPWAVEGEAGAVSSSTNSVLRV